jgi:mRNA deadenylase 3'-5' endonuclease subunit Ccr4
LLNIIAALAHIRFVDRFLVTSYNILVPKHEGSMGVPYDIVHWPRRRQMIDKELQELDSDFVALQVRIIPNIVNRN